jgi:hypothetical protein
MNRPLDLPTVSHASLFLYLSNWYCYEQDTKHQQRYNIDETNLTKSPIQTHPRHFYPGLLFDTSTFEQIQWNVDHPSKPSWSDNEDDCEENLNDILNQARTIELEYLSQLIQDDRPTDTDEIADVLLELVNQVPEIIKNDEKIIDFHPYTPIHQTGIVAECDQPSLIKEFQFNLQPPLSTKQSTLRLNAKSFAIIAWTHVSKEDVMTYIKNDFGIEQIQYICISEELNELNHERHLHIQIILKDTMNTEKRFLDDITQTHCNYQVTQNDRTWNEYIRKDDNYIEFGTFQSVSTHEQQQWPLVATSTSVSSVSSSLATTTTTIQAEERHQLAEQTITLAKTSISDAMDFIRKSIPEKFLAHSTW